ncbi:response regulator [Sporosarcina thermotolerans]|uniref:Transcriptional regulatory protein n=1 Tax=Sporosarcina thermotolerans TaxID=633404 RepID=A0AAW9A556_9BACL|nr:response regulator [Sporosarcina thermotolerans]MDW0116107.1 response regulator [Sporosarcina thermotolerans]WHT48075.1 response regulator [Sporosarcina thermotolerans]
MINVLIVEDDFRIAEIHQQLLESIEGIQVVGKALRAEEVHGYFQKERIDLLLVDIYMPDQLGIDLVMDLKKTYTDLSFIMITAAKDMEILERSVKAGAFHYLIKPLQLQKLQEVIEQFKKRKSILESDKPVEQSLVDQLFSKHSFETQQQETLPKGVNALTLSKVMETMTDFSEGTTVEEIGEQIGVSRTTARRYMEYLVSIGKMKAELEYGIVGRPERKYFMV